MDAGDAAIGTAAVTDDSDVVADVAFGVGVDAVAVAVAAIVGTFFGICTYV